METRSGLLASQWPLKARCALTSGRDPLSTWKREERNEAFLYVRSGAGLSVLSVETPRVALCISGVFAYHEHVSHAWVYKMKYVTISTWKTRALVESTASLLPEPFCSFKWACWLQLPSSTMLARKTSGRFFSRGSSKKPANSLIPCSWWDRRTWPGACVAKEPLHLLGRVLLLLNSLGAKRSLIFICVHPLGQDLVIKGELLWIESLRVRSHSERSPIHRTVTASGDTAPGVVDTPPPFIVAACKGCVYPQNNSSMRTHTQILDF